MKRDPNAQSQPSHSRRQYAIRSSGESDPSAITIATASFVKTSRPDRTA
jgi:hypothetical protein